MNKHTCIECDMQCLMHSKDWHECHMSDRCAFCGEWTTDGEDCGGDTLCPMCACRLEEDEACNICGYSHVVSLGTYRAKVAKRFEAVRYE